MNLADTSRAVLKRPAQTGSETALLVHIYPPGPGLGRCYSLAGGTYLIGRDEDCSISIHHSSVSRRHACVEAGPDGYFVADLQSTNGTFVNDAAVESTILKDGDYLRIGNCIYRFLSSSNAEAKYHEEIYRLIIIDALTDIPNKRYLTEFLDRELARCARYNRCLSLILFDIDRFKTVNDRLGHLGGDFTLRELAACLRTCVRKEELIARYGGEEFVVVLPETPHEGAVNVAERIRQLVERHSFRYENEIFKITISLGVVTASGSDAITPRDLIQEADAKLYQAKRAGTNRVVS
jgi:diguanylate cyclase (GGDEF)-like protein